MQQMRATQHERLAAETAEERDARLRQLSSSQCKRLVAETAERPGFGS